MPANCSSGQYVSGAYGSGWYCSAPSVTESDPLWTGNQSRVSALESSNTTTNSRIDSINSTKLDATDQRYNDTVLANTKALPGTCSGNQVVQNTTTSGVQCATPSISETDPNAYNGTLAYNSSLANYYLASNPFSFYNSTNPPTESDPLWTSNYTAFNSSWSSTYNATYNVLLNQLCPSGQVVNGTLANGTFICTTPTFTESDPKYVADNATIARTGTCAANSYASATTTTGVTCSAPSGVSDAHTHNILNVTGADTNACTGTDKVSNVTFTNGNLDIVCTTDATGGGGANVTVFTATGQNTWTKPASGTIVKVQLWAAGGSGGTGGAADAGGGGGGGGYLEFTLPITSFAATEICWVGTGGAAVVGSGTGLNGITGGPTNMTVNGATNGYVVYGGGPGFGLATGADGGGGGGGGIWGPGLVGTATVGGLGGIGCAAAQAGTPVGLYGYECGGGGGTTNGGYASWGGGGGGYGQDSGTAYSGGKSIWGGGGGAGGDGAGTPEGTGGTSSHGGKGGAGATDVNNAQAGTQPGGGGGGAEAGNSGAGGNGMCIITVL